MSFRAILVAALFGIALPLAPASPGWARDTAAAEQPFLLEELMRASGLEGVFDQFGLGVAASLRLQGLTQDVAFLEAWEATALSVFDPEAMKAELAGALGGVLSHEEFGQLGRFYRSEFGARVVGMELATQAMSIKEQNSALWRGELALLAMRPEARRHRQYEELLELSLTEVTVAMYAQSMRAMMVGLTMLNSGDIEIPWELIDAEIARVTGPMAVEMQSTYRVLFADTYRGLTDAEMDRYLAHIRTPTARKFYAAAMVAIGKTMNERMLRFGSELSRRATQQNI